MTSPPYQTPLVTRYGGKEMAQLFSETKRICTWRRVWIALAEAQHELGLASIRREDIECLQSAIEKIDWNRVQELEKETRHDVMAHVKAYGEVCPQAAGILHLGATSAFVTDNADLILFREALKIIRVRLAHVMSELADFARQYRDHPTLGRTHYQPAQPTTVGKRATLWLADLLLDWDDLTTLIDGLLLRGAKGTTGTQDSFLKLFEGDADRVEELDQKITEKLGFPGSFPVVGQTYPRKIDSRIFSVLSGLAQSAAKFAGDIRILSALGEMDEPMGVQQVGSSAMPYKRNPMRSERISSIARLILSLSLNGPMTAMLQGFERTLDDSANRRIALPEAFLATDGILRLYGNIVRGLEVHNAQIRSHLESTIPFLASEEVLAAGVAAGGDRQVLHEGLRTHARAASEEMRSGKPNDFFSRIGADPEFNQTEESLEALAQPERFIGRSPAQVDRFLSKDVLPRIQPFLEQQTSTFDIDV